MSLLFHRSGSVSISVRSCTLKCATRFSRNIYAVPQRVMKNYDPRCRCFCGRRNFPEMMFEDDASSIIALRSLPPERYWIFSLTKKTEKDGRGCKRSASERISLPKVSSCKAMRRRFSPRPADPPTSSHGLRYVLRRISKGVSNDRLFKE